jgi:amino acid adenylation domain-containing protein
MMSSTSDAVAHRSGREHNDETFWLERLDVSLPRATLVPDRRRTTAEARRYDAVEFAVDADSVRVLKSLDPAAGVSDLALCTFLVAALLSKYHRDDNLVIGLHWSGSAGAPGPRPVLLSCGSESSSAALLEAVCAEVQRVLSQPADALRYLPQAMGAAHSTHRCPLYDLAIAVGHPDLAFDFATHPVDAAFVFHVEAGRITGQLHYAQELFDRPRMQSVAEHLMRLTSALAAAPAVALRTLSVLSPREREHIVAGFNQRSAAYPLQRTMHALFEEQCQRTPHAVAVIHGAMELNYDALNQRANRLANTLLAGGLRKGDFVCLLLERSCDFVVAMLACFKAGAAYVPLDPTYPQDRIQYMLNDSSAAVLVSNRGLLQRFGGVVAGARDLATVIALDSEPPAGTGHASIGAQQLAAASTDNPQLPLAGSDRAYMIYTSGSTGRPKGAICRHDGALNHLFGELDGIGIAGSFSFLQTAASSSDISVWQFIAPLLRGGTTVIADYEVVVDPEALFALIRSRQVVVAEPVPIVLRALIDHIEGLAPEQRELRHLRCMMVTGEALPAELVDRWLALYPMIPVANTYGPTETSDDVTLSVLREPIGARYAVAPIGSPLPNVRLFVLDTALQPVPLGVPGEICVGGLAVGEGYWRQPDKTRDVFVPSPFADVAPGPMYRTGDLGRWLPDGQIEFLGRVDQQVKVRGFRVEPGEIEAAMTQHPAVQDAAVVAADDGRGTGRLIGYYTLRKDQSLSPAQLRTHLKMLLAEHMVPSSLTVLAALPRTPLGKLDRKALAGAQPRPATEHEQRIAPRTATERAVAAVWSTVTGNAAVSIGDNFFEIGGDSISTIRVIAELRRAGYKVAPRDVFERPTLAALAEHLELQRTTTPRGPTAGAPAALAWDDEALRQRLREAFPTLQDAYPLSATQRGIYYQGLLLPKTSGAYIEQVTFRVDGALDATRFEAAWQHVVDGTDVLRAAVVRRGGQSPSQVILSQVGFALDLLDLTGKSEAEQVGAIDALVLAERQRGFDLKSPPLMRVVLVQLGPNHARVVWTYHHLILDGWSEPLVLSAVFRAYQALASSKAFDEADPARYRDFVTWTEGQDLTEAEAYWRAAMEAFDTPAVVVDPSPAVTPPTPGEITHGWCDVVLSDSDTQRLDAVARQVGVTPATMIHGAWALLLHRATALPDVVLGSVASGRGCDVPHIASLPGLVVVTQPLRSRPAADSTVTAWLRLLQLQMAAMREHEHTPLAQIQQWSSVPAARRPLFDSIVVVGNYAGNDLTGACTNSAVSISEVASFTQPQYALTLFVVVGAALRVRLVYEKKRYAATTAKVLLDEYAGVLNSLAENPVQRLAGVMRRP